MWTNSLPPELLNTVHCMDCLEFMRTLPDGCVDLTVTSPPYDNLRSYNNDIDSTRWEIVRKPILKELYRITKEWWVVVRVVWDATINWSETLTSFKQALYAKEDCWFRMHDTMIYQKNSYPFPPSNRYFWVFEYMFVLSKWNPITTVLGKVLTVWKWHKSSTQREADWSISAMKYEMWKEERVRDNIRKYDVGFAKTTNDKYTFNHPAMFPEELAEDHILSRSNEWDIVFDPFMWSWTTAKMAKKYWRNYLWCELSSEYCDIIHKRLQNTTVSLFHS